MGAEVGFSGTKKGMTPDQIKYVLRLLRGVSKLHHGDCVGADAQVDSLCATFGVERCAWPGMDAFGKSPSRAGCNAETIMLPAQPYYGRNRLIAMHGVDGLVAAPEGAEASFPRSGTWHTVRQARRLKRKLFIVLPDGTEVNV